MKNYLAYLECPKCNKRYVPSQLVNLCDCGTPVLVRYDLESLKKEFDPSVWQERSKGLWRYRELLPVRDDGNIVSLGEGGTPVINTVSYTHLDVYKRQGAYVTGSCYVYR